MKLFMEPELEVTKFDVVDIISTSETDDLQLPDMDNGIGWG